MFDHLLHKMLGFSDDIELDDNLKETPKRYLKLWTEMTSGYREDPKKYLQKCFPVNSPKLAKIEVVRKGKVRRAKLYYLRDRVGKATRVKEKI